MAKGDRDDRAKVKFKYVEFELEGGNTSLQESLRSLAASLSRGGRTVAVLPQKAATPHSNGASAPEEVDPQQDLFSESDEQLEEIPNEAPTPTRASRSGKVRAPQILDLDLTSGSMPLAKFCQEKAPDSDIAKYLVIAAWLKQFREISAVSIDHIHTCYRHLGWYTPKNPLQPLIDLKKKKSWLNKADGKGEYAINHVGENEVAKMTKGEN